MSVTQYIGARYVPLFADPIDWDITKQYEPLTIVYYQGNSFTSRQAVPSGIDISNGDYWALTGNYNAQIERYRTEVQTFNSRITANTDSNTNQDSQLAGTASSGLKVLIDRNTTDITANAAAISTHTDQLAGTSASGLKSLIDNNAAAIGTHTDQLAGTSASGLKSLIDDNTASISSLEAKVNAKRKMVVIGDSFSTLQHVDASHIWYKYVADFLGAQTYPFVEAGSGFSRGGTNGHTLLNLVESAAASSSFENSEVEWVFIYGGLNDITYDTIGNAVSSGIPQTCALARTSFPNAHIVLCGINAWASGLSLTSSRRGQIYYEHQIKSTPNVFASGVTFISMCCALAFNSSFYNTANHPNVEGNKLIAGWILSQMFGTHAQFTKSGDLLNASGTDVGNFTYYLQPGRIDYTYLISGASSGDEYVEDGMNIMTESQTAFSGSPLVAGGSDGYLGTKNTNGLVHAVGKGYCRGSIVW